MTRDGAVRGVAAVGPAGIGDLSLGADRASSQENGYILPHPWSPKLALYEAVL